MSDKGGRPELRIALIGAFRVLAPDGEDLTPRGRKARALLAILALFGPLVSLLVALVTAGDLARTSLTGQFFLVFRDSPLPPNYTPFGTITEGLPVVDRVAAGGDDGAYGQSAGGGHPKTRIALTSVTVS